MPNGPVVTWDDDCPVKIAENVYWVGVHDLHTRTQSNSYLVLDDDEAVLIDGGSRSAFPSVTMKVIQTGISPSAIGALIFQNYNPSSCGSVAHFEAIIDRKDLKIISDSANHMFIQHFSPSVSLLSLVDLDYQFKFPSGKRLEFISTPFAHSAGSFVTFDEGSGMLFTADLFSASSSRWRLLLRLTSCCKTCRDYSNCPDQMEYCPLQDILGFHQNIMASERALKFALDRIAQVPFSTIAPQHGSIIDNPEDIVLVCDLLSSLKDVGIDGIIGNKSFFELGNMTPLRERLEAKRHSVQPERCCAKC
jgi:flavorubredoxin